MFGQDQFIGERFRSHSDQIGEFEGMQSEFRIFGGKGKKFVGHCHSVMYMSMRLYKFSSFLGGGHPPLYEHPGSAHTHTLIKTYIYFLIFQDVLTQLEEEATKIVSRQKEIEVIRVEKTNFFC